MLLLKYYELENAVSSSERFERIAKFEKTRIELGIPNPYSFAELLKANERWTELGHIWDCQKVEQT